MDRMKGSHDGTPRSRKNNSGISTPRSLAAQTRTKNPCAGCKRSRQKCTGGPPSVCSLCKIRNITCEPGKPETPSIEMETHFVFEYGQSLQRNRQRRNTVCTAASSLASPIVGESHIADNVNSPTSPVFTLSDVASENVCESPTTQSLVSGFNSFAIGDASVIQNVTVSSSTSTGETGQPGEHISFSGQLSFETPSQNDTENIPDVGSLTGGASYQFMNSGQLSSSMLGESSKMTWDWVTSQIPIGLPSTSSSLPKEIPFAATTGIDFTGVLGDDDIPFPTSLGNTGVLTGDSYSGQYSDLNMDLDLWTWLLSLLDPS